MRLAIVNLTRQGLSGGYIKYLRRLVPLLARHPEIAQLEVFAPEAVRQRLRAEPWQIHGWTPAEMRRGFRGLRETVQEWRPDVVFVPTANWLDFGDTPVVVMVRNMEPLEVPFGGNPVRVGAINLARRYLARRACHHATRVIAVSQHVRQYLIDRWDLSPSKISVVYHGVDSPEASPAAQAPRVLGQLAGRPFVFAAGSIRPARGLGDLIGALGHLGSGSPAQAVVAGHVDEGMERHYRALRRQAAEGGIADRIVWTGALNEGEMRWCYENCAALIVTSRAEACPNIALEGMSHGCACVSVDRPPMPEFFGSAALYYRTGDPAGLAGALTPLLAGHPNVLTLKAGSSSRARDFDWRTTAEQTVGELRAALRS